jgi:hypothetical protein
MVLEQIFEADFLPVSYGFRPKRRAPDAVAEIDYYGTHGYRWVLDADVEGCVPIQMFGAGFGRVGTCSVLASGFIGCRGLGPGVGLRPDLGRS